MFTKKDGYEGTAVDFINKIQRDPAASFWLKHAISELCGRDPVDALNDAATLHRAMSMREAEVYLSSLEAAGR